MHHEFTSHAGAMVAASRLYPLAVWITASGDVGQTSETDVALEAACVAVMILRQDGTASLYEPK